MEKNFQDNSLNASQNMTIFLETELVLEDSVEGVPSNKLQKGDLVLAKIVDKRDIAQYLSRLLGGKKQDEIIPLTIPIETIEIEKEKVGGVNVYTRFSAGVVGLACLSSDDKVKLVKRTRKKWFEKILDIFFKDTNSLEIG